MSEAAQPIDRDEEMLSRLAELDLAWVEQVHAQAMAATGTDEINARGRTYQRAARSLRQTLALKAKLKREREQAPQDAPPRKPGAAAVARRITELKDALVRVAWTEAESPETADWLERDIDMVIAAECVTNGFATEPLDDHVARLCLQLGFPAELAGRWRDLPDPPPCERAPPDLDFESSA
jgi:hypothetical protein